MFELRVVVPNFGVFENYWYGYGEIAQVAPTGDGRVAVVVNYGDDSYRANYQAGRFGSGLYSAVVTEL